MMRSALVNAAAPAVLLATALLTMPVNAAVSAQEAAELGTTLTKGGANPAANADGSIPAYDPAKAITRPVGDYKPYDSSGGWPFNDPYAAEKPVLSITAANMDKSADRLDDATKFMLKNYAGYRLDIYPTHRSAVFPEWVYENTKKCATTTKLIANGLAFENGHACIPFPIPKNGYEAMWNALLPYSPPRLQTKSRIWTIDRNGSSTEDQYVVTKQEFPFWDPALQSTEYAQRLANVAIGPPALVGTVNILYYPLRTDKVDTSAWTYIPAQRRVRLAPEFTYDTVAATLGGLSFFDELFFFSGKMDRFDFKLIGKKELYVPYNNIKFRQAPYKDSHLKHYVSPDYMRWELHRVWVVEATRKAGVRHANSKKVLYIDEDTWQFMIYNGYDSEGKVIRINMNTGFVWQKPLFPYVAQLIYSLDSGQWLDGSEISGEKEVNKEIKEFPKGTFSPEAIAGRSAR